MNANADNPGSAAGKTDTVKAGIVMVTYNQQPYIEQAITSILSQEFRGSFELIIGDDCSTDGTADIVRRFHERYPETIRLITSDRNVGADANFKRCVRACKTEFISFCEGDDYWNSPHTLQRQIDSLQSRQQTGAVHSDFSHARLISGTWKVLPAFNRAYGKNIPRGSVFDRLLFGNFIQTCTFCARTDLVLEFLDSELPTGSYSVGDWPLFLHISASHEIDYIDEPLATYRLTPKSITNSGHEQDILRAENAMTMISDFCRTFGTPSAIENEAHRASLAHIVRKCTLTGNRPEFQRYWKSYLETRPSRRAIAYLRLEHLVFSNLVSRRLYLAYSRIKHFISSRYLYR